MAPPSLHGTTWWGFGPGHGSSARGKQQPRSRHLIGYAGRVTAHPAWWANLWFAWHSLGPRLVSTILASAAVAVIVRRDRLVAWCLAALAEPFVFHCVIAGNALPFYWVLWMPAVIALSAVGIRELVGASVLFHDRWPQLLAMTSALAVAILLVAAPSETIRVATAPRVGASVVALVRSRLGLHGTILTTGTYLAELTPNLPNTTVVDAPPSALRSIDMVVVGEPCCRTLLSPTARS